MRVPCTPKPEPQTLPAAPTSAVHSRSPDQGPGFWVGIRPAVERIHPTEGRIHPTVWCIRPTVGLRDMPKTSLGSHSTPSPLEAYCRIGRIGWLLEGTSAAPALEVWELGFGNWGLGLQVWVGGDGYQTFGVLRRTAQATRN